MNDGISGGFAAAKLLPALFGILGATLVFLFYWPKTAKEGFTRLAAAGATSHFFGDPALRVVVHTFGDYVQADEIRSGVYFLVGGLGFFVVGAVVRWFKTREGKDIQQMVQDVKKPQ